MKQLTGNAGLFYIAWQLSKRGWNVMPTVRNAKGADMYAAPADNEDAVVSIQSKALSKKAAVNLGLDLANLRSTWWVITTYANSDQPECYILTLDEVKATACRDKGGKQQYWLEAKNFNNPDFKRKYQDKWDRMTT
jgi:hypothetical protein